MAVVGAPDSRAVAEVMRAAADDWSANAGSYGADVGIPRLEELVASGAVARAVVIDPTPAGPVLAAGVSAADEACTVHTGGGCPWDPLRSAAVALARHLARAGWRDAKVVRVPPKDPSPGRALPNAVGVYGFFRPGPDYPHDPPPEALAAFVDAARRWWREAGGPVHLRLGQQGVEAADEDLAPLWELDRTHHFHLDGWAGDPKSQVIEARRMFGAFHLRAAGPGLDPAARAAIARRLADTAAGMAADLAYAAVLFHDHVPVSLFHSEIDEGPAATTGIPTHGWPDTFRNHAVSGWVSEAYWAQLVTDTHLDRLGHPDRHGSCPDDGFECAPTADPKRHLLTLGEPEVWLDPVRAGEARRTGRERLHGAIVPRRDLSDLDHSAYLSLPRRPSRHDPAPEWAAMLQPPSGYSIVSSELTRPLHGVRERYAQVWECGEHSIRLGQTCPPDSPLEGNPALDRPHGQVRVMGGAYPGHYWGWSRRGRTFLLHCTQSDIGLIDDLATQLNALPPPAVRPRP